MYNMKSFNPMEDDTINLILHGCKLAKDLEVSLPDMDNQPTLLSKSCQDLFAIFSTAKQWIDRQSPDSAGSCLSPLYFDGQQVQPHIWKQLLRKGISSSILLPQSTYMAGTSSGSGSAGALMERRDAGNDVTVASVIPGIPTKERAPLTPSRRHRRRNNGEDRWTVKISAPRIGNMEIPPDDGYTWRKYGQKEILGSKFPRGYFRCTHRKLYQCPAKKQVQRLDNDPSTFEVTYRHLHTCHMSSTAPSVPPPSLPQLTPQDMTPVITAVPSQPPLPYTSGSSSAWMPIAFDVCGAGFTRSMNVGGDIPGPSASVEAESRFSTTIGDVVFNHGDGHSSAVEFVFPYMEERWKGREQK